MEKINPAIFKSYDIRGIYPDDVTEDAAYLIGQGFAQITKAKKVVVGRDMRNGSPQLTRKIIEGLTSQGVDVDDIGMVPIDGVYFAVGTYKYDGGIMITASHNPKEYNGFKMPLYGTDGLSWLRGKELYDFIQDKTFAPGETVGKVTEKDITEEYLEHILSFADTKKIKPLKIVVDAGNGMAGKIMPLLFKRLPCELIPLNFELDGNFPSHPSNPLLPESQAQITKAVVDEGADFGVILDGDTDRLFFITETGEFIRADITLLILAKHFLERTPGAGIVYNVICSKAVPEKIKEWGGNAIRSQVGFVNVARAARENGGLMGGELSAHYSFKDNFYADSGFIAFVILLALISEHDKKLSKIITDLAPYSKSPEINLEVGNIPEVIEAVKKKYIDGNQDELDGLTVEYAKWWFNVRPSNTEPLLRVTVEGNTTSIREENQTALVDFIKGVAK